MNLTQFAEWLIEAYHSDDGMPEAKEICREARAALSAQPVAGAVAVDETGWLIEHSGEILPGAEQRAQVSWLRVQMKFNGYGAREFGFTHDANEALRFSRREDAEAVLAMHLGARPPDWYSNPFSVTEHMWPAAPQAQAAPAPEPSAPIDAFKLYAELRDLVAEAGAVDTMIGRPEVLRSRLSALCKRVGQLTTDLPIGTAPAPEPSAQAVAHPSHQTVREWMPVSEALRLSDLWTAGDLDNCGQWRAAIKVLADEVRALAASPQPAEPSAQGEPVAPVHIRLMAQSLRNTLEDPFPREEIDLDAVLAVVKHVLASAPSTQPRGVVEAVPLAERWVVVCESVLDVGFGGDVREGGRPELGYALLANATTFDSEDKAKAAIRNAKLPIGWVYMPLSRLLPDLRGIAPKAAQEKT